jgi:hypothetical protein
VARPESENQGRAELRPRDKTDYEGAKSEALVHMKREHWQS